MGSIPDIFGGIGVVGRYLPFLNRSLGPGKYKLDYRGQMHVPYDNQNRLSRARHIWLY